MSRNTGYQFVDTDTDALVSDLVSAYETITGRTLKPASPEKVFISWVAGIILQERVYGNYIGNQNVPSRAERENLDALADLFYQKTRPPATSAICTVRFHISEAQTSAILIPLGSRVTDADGTMMWETTEDAYIEIGNTYVDIHVRCQTEGEAGNDWTEGQINTIVDLYDYCTTCENITVSANGTDEATDDEFYDLLRGSQEAYSVAGPQGAYIYHAKAANSDIADVVANSPKPGYVSLYLLMNDGTIAGEEVKRAVETTVTAGDVRPLTDCVTVSDPEPVPYNISFTYYIQRNSTLSAAKIEGDVAAAVQEYISWQSGALGRDINPSHLIGLLMQAGIKRVAVTEPEFVQLSGGDDDDVPQIATVGSVTVTNGGYEDE